MVSTRKICISFLILLPPLAYTFPAHADAPAPLKLTGEWLGQDGTDLVSPSAVMAPNDVQDVHIRISGIPAARVIKSGVLTGYGGGQWNYNGTGGSWKIALERQDGAPTADFYFDPGDFNTDRQWDFQLTFDDGTTGEAWFPGKKTDPGLRMPNASLKAQWLGQDGQDWTGPGPSVGPDGFQDVHLALSGLSSKVEIRSLNVSLMDSTTPPAGAPSAGATAPHTWEFGLNVKGYANAELIRHTDDPSRADLFFSANSNLAGRTLLLKLIYMPGQPDSATVTAGTCSPALRMPLPTPVPWVPMKLSAAWLGQDNHSAHRGDIHVALRGLPPARIVDAAALSDSVGGCWVYSAAGGPPFYVPEPGEAVQPALPLNFSRTPGSGAIDLTFPPFRNEKGAHMTLRLRFTDGKTSWVQFAGGLCDPYLQGAIPAATRVNAKPGDDLQALVNQYGTVILSPGTYTLNGPLELTQPITLTGSPDAVLEFNQKPDDTSQWRTAIKIDSSNTTLNGFKVRFAGPIRWAAEDWTNGSAVLGMTAPTPDHHDPGLNIQITNMDIEGPPIAPGLPLQQEPRMMRLIYCASGKIIHNILKGGVTDVMHGPWGIRDNDYRGTQPGAFDYSAFACHYTHDYYLGHNMVHAVGPSGKNWRFLVMTQSGDSDIVEDNDARNIGPMDNDTIPNPNAPEMLLTEAYRLCFEGKPAAISAGGFILQIPMLMHSGVRTGCVVSILDGPHRGEWVRIAQPVDTTTFLMDRPLPSGSYDISISTGFVDETYQRNTIDMRGSSTAADMILAGNHFGTRVLNNHTLGGGDSFQFQATPTEWPNIWGWSHAPFLDALVEGNVLEDSLHGGLLTVQHSTYIKSNRGRVYMTATLRNNTVRWTAGFLALHKQSPAITVGSRTYPPVLTVGDKDSIDPGELLLTQGGNRVQAPGYGGTASLNIWKATLNGQPKSNYSIPLDGVLYDKTNH